MKIFCGVGVVLFSLFSYWQLNDLGQYGTEWWQGWFLTYLLTAIVSGVSFFIILPRWVYAGCALLALGHAVLRSFSIQTEETILYNPDNPAGNETGGLIIVCLWFLALTLWKRKKS